MEVRDWASAIALLREGVGVSLVPESTLPERRRGVRTVRPDFEEHMASLIPAGRMGRPEELARAALFLASDAGSFVNGIELHVNGGMTLI
nr:SDR family oxidoreductase [Agrobacterium sp. NCPPB 925]